ncbi:MAG TPA: iron-containing alcohol dehydrogenase, partial [Chthonomonadaceae bacterium]|nr:iron-containing alcohol dehydrogenase [Chthonomonadaceae bacterium]
WTLAQAGGLAAAMGTRALVVTGRSAVRAAPLTVLLLAAGVESTRVAAEGEPTVDAVRQAVETARAAACDLVIGFGGGSTIDLGKAVAALLGNGGDPLDYLEVIGRGQALKRPSAPFIAIPTTAGTGSEATRNAVIGSPEHGVKVSLRSAYMLPHLALIDPDLALSLPPEVTAATGLDALTQLIEPFVSPRATPITDALCRDGMERVCRSLRRAVAVGSDAEAREEMALAALFSGIALANAGLGAVHGFAGPLGGMVDAPHGALCAALLPAVCAANVPPCGRAIPAVEPYCATPRRPASLPATPRPSLKTASPGSGSSAATWPSRRSRPTASRRTASRRSSRTRGAPARCRPTLSASRTPSCSKSWQRRTVRAQSLLDADRLAGTDCHFAGRLL